MCDGFTPINEIDPKGAAIWSEMSYELTPHPAMSLSRHHTGHIRSIQPLIFLYLNYRIIAFISWR